MKLGSSIGLGNQRVRATQAEGHCGKNRLFRVCSWDVLSNLHPQSKTCRSLLRLKHRKNLPADSPTSAHVKPVSLLRTASPTSRPLPSFQGVQASLPHGQTCCYPTSLLRPAFTRGGDSYTEAQAGLHDVICAISAFARKSSLPLAKAKSPRLGAPPAAPPPGGS